MSEPPNDRWRHGPTAHPFNGCRTEPRLTNCPPEAELIRVKFRSRRVAPKIPEFADGNLSKRRRENGQRE